MCTNACESHKDGLMMRERNTILFGFHFGLLFQAALFCSLFSKIFTTKHFLLYFMAIHLATTGWLRTDKLRSARLRMPISIHFISFCQPKFFSDSHVIVTAARPNSVTEFTSIWIDWVWSIFIYFSWMMLIFTVSASILSDKHIDVFLHLILPIYGAIIKWTQRSLKVTHRNWKLI